MIRNFFLLLSLLFLFSCTKKEKKIYSNYSGQSLDSIKYYLSESKRNSEKKFFFLDKAKKVYQNVGENNIEASKIMYDVALEYYNNDSLDKFYTISHKLIKSFQLNKDSLDIVKVFRYKGNYFKRKQQYDSAFNYYLKAEKLYIIQNDKFNQAVILFNKSIVQYAIGDYLGSDLSLAAALRNFRLFDDKRKIYETLGQIAAVSAELNDFDKAIDYNNKALKILKESNFPDKDLNIALCLNNLGYDYQKINDFENAYKNYVTALNLKNLKNLEPELYSTLLDNIGYVQFKQKKYDNVENNFLKSLKIRDSLNLASGEVLSHTHLSEYYWALKDKVKSLEHANTAILLARESKSPLNIMFALKQASSVDVDNVPKYSKELFKLNDSLQTVERNSRDRFAKIELETEEILQQKDSLEQKNRSILNYFIGTIAIGALLFFMRAQRAKSRELLLRQAQQRANEDIYKLIISQQNKLEEGRVLEKTRIAKELHDGVLGRLFGLRLNLDGLNHRDDDAAIQERIRCLEELKIIEQDLREISHELSREKYVLVNNFVAIVNNLLEEQAKINPAKLNALIGENVDWDLLSNTTKINLYRILQECLQNINKYANAKNIKVEFRKDKKGNLVLNITDDGDGFEVDKKSRGIGLKNIVTRTHESDGIIEIKSAPGKGTRISITVPLEHKNIKH
ncbi:tetratricopeptide repeat-containing sensor histidine kinase [Flavobacterium sp. N1719]|uniref:tetratricopeptide repeat-containing sensor histidine kinase n=1 Tax=Flavobacterium sp. N1719 TaxID=2885633 RepID=UPI002222FF14|nr:tetratricopeptide repeat-containing sensor histidine kinase [Flavobacterium sp. N1719]